jgi:hypothetical protein
VVGLALLYPALGWSGSLLAIMDIRARSSGPIERTMVWTDLAQGALLVAGEP